MAINDSDIRLQDLDINHQGPDVKHQDSGIDHQDSHIEHQFVPGGYERLANWMSLHPELSIFRRFGSLYTESILYLQAEIAQLELRLRQIRAEERKHGLPELHVQLQEQSWESLYSNHDAGQGSPGRDKFEIHMRLRDLLPHYYQALDLQSKIHDLRRPHRKALKGLRMYMNRPCMGNIKILSPDWRTWGDESELMESDLLTFENCIMDTFSSFLNYGILDIYDKCVGRHIRQKITRTRNGSNILPLTSSDRNVVTYSYSTIALFAQSVTVLLACMLPIAAIMLLNSIDDMTKRLNVIACLTGAFSVSMRLFTMATLAEIFAATAA
ncbi:hypothetical protein V8F06_012157 [Rhypophila decipiens]